MKKNKIIFELIKLKKNNQENRSMILVEKASNNDLKKALEKRIENAIKYSVSNFAREMSDILEDLLRCRENISAIDSNLEKALNMIIDNTIKSFEKFGVSRIYPLNEEFNPCIHESLLQTSCKKTTGTITKVIKSGYKINSRLLKPALVIIGK